MSTKYRGKGVRGYAPTGFTYTTPLSTNGRVYALYENAQAVTSEGHPYHKLGRDSRRDIGGPFLNRKIEFDLGKLKEETSRGVYSARYNSYNYSYSGMWVPHTDFSAAALGPVGSQSLESYFDSLEKINNLLNYADLVPQATSTSSLDAYGTAVISSLRPTNPVVDLAEFFGELAAERKIFSVPGRAGSFSGEYLNYMFGIAPTISTYQDLRTAYSSAEKLLEQYSRDSGRLVRRQYRPEPETTVSKVVSTGVYPHLLRMGVPTALAQQGSLSVIETTTEKWGFSGAFMYYLPKEGILRDLRELDRLYGVVPGIDTAWNLLPFSWLLDYKLSIGAALENINSFALDGLVMPYGYVMRERRTAKQYTWTGNIKDSSGSWVPRTLEATINSVVQERRAANPFGFGLKDEDLNLRQWSIIAALGLSRM